tara:strand:- start:203 stop:646 length:444 start_codon:yes stop_codon:yes gene_type:complete
MGESIKSRYTPIYPSKYQGNAKYIICRSSWERKFCQWCDMNNSIISWASEEFSIPYVSPKDNRVHKYYPDYLIKVKEKNDMIKTYVVEVKPYKQTRPPKTPKRKTKSYLTECVTYAVNQAKWKAAKEFCEDHRIEFKVVTEKELGIR